MVDDGVTTVREAEGRGLGVCGGRNREAKDLSEGQSLTDAHKVIGGRNQTKCNLESLFLPGIALFIFSICPYVTQDSDVSVHNQVTYCILFSAQTITFSLHLIKLTPCVSWYQYNSEPLKGTVWQDLVIRRSIPLSFYRDNSYCTAKYAQETTHEIHTNCNIATVQYMF